MSLKRIPSVGKSLMSRIFPFSSAIFIARYLNSDAAVRKTPMCPGPWHRDTVREVNVSGLTAAPGRSQRLNSPDLQPRVPWRIPVAPYLLPHGGSVP